MALNRFRDESGFLSEARNVAERLRSLIDENRQFAIICHNDADGLSAGAIASAMLLREGVRFFTRAVREIEEALEALRSLPESCVPIFVDMGSGYLDELSQAFGEKPLLVLDHHEPLGSASSNVIQLNPHIYGINGAEEVSGAGVVYFVARSLNEENVLLSPVAVIGALGDLQDRSDGRGLHGLNELIVRDAVDEGLLKVEGRPPLLWQEL